MRIIFGIKPDFMGDSRRADKGHGSFGYAAVVEENADGAIERSVPGHYEQVKFSCGEGDAKRAC